MFSKKQWLDVGAALAAIKDSERTIAAKAEPTGLTHYPISKLELLDLRYQAMLGNDR